MRWIKNCKMAHEQITIPGIAATSYQWVLRVTHHHFLNDALCSEFNFTANCGRKIRLCFCIINMKIICWHCMYSNALLACFLWLPFGFKYCRKYAVCFIIHMGIKKTKRFLWICHFSNCKIFEPKFCGKLFKFFKNTFWIFLKIFNSGYFDTFWPNLNNFK